MALRLDSRYPGRFNPGDSSYPQGSFKNRTAPGALDGSYLEKDWANDKEGFFQRLMIEAGITPNGTVDTALSSQYYDALLQAIQDNSADTINAPIATVAAAGTINLTIGAPSSSQIAISGTGVSINGFTVAANRFFVVKMTGASNTLINSASLVTGRGANIPVVAGDSFLMRSTSANTVEILCGMFQVDRTIGTGQTWQDVTASRATSTTYTNTTGRPIMIHFIGNVGAVGGLYIDGVHLEFDTLDTESITAIVPPGSLYSVVAAIKEQWVELR